ncbi:hypothetical protein HPP92_021617 [Vanilla planifolia]|uniref:WAT1-related protein n=1 Tax=Vanilla planifolia TaxID=51239 RepID=A0A835Q2X1_VANPL|nr:hypothetical protein HPP92_021951 [Vanilla planifolia]KAG0463141.1 hypothetical protein HPP92_021617 [Vanilla planifolia]
MGKQWLQKQMPVLAMVSLQFMYASISVAVKAALAQDISPMVFLVYRQLVASLLLLTISFIAIRKRQSELTVGRKGFCLAFMSAFIGVTIYQSCYYQGLRLASATIASSLSNIIPAVTFLMAAAVGLEKVRPMSMRTMAKALGTILCLCGAIIMALFKGQSLLNVEFKTTTVTSFLRGAGENWGLGCLLLIASFSCWSAWLVMQVPICRKHLDPLSLSTWMSILSTMQLAILTLFMEPYRKWKINSGITLPLCLYTGLGSAVSYCVQSWCISIRGPLFSAMFSPLSTVITTIGASIFIHEKLYIGSLAGSAAVIGGLYIVLWGKAADEQINKNDYPHKSNDVKITISTENSHEICVSNLKEPLIQSLDGRN